MNTRMSRRHLMVLSGGAALSAGFAARSVGAQSTASPFTFASGAELTWVDPWTLNEDNLAAPLVADSAALRGADRGEVVLGYHDAPQSIDDVSNAFLEFLVGDPAQAQIIAGGSEESVGAGGVVEATLAYNVYHLTLNDEAWGLYVQLVDDVQVGVFVAPVTVFAAEMASAQASVQIDGVGVFGSADGAEFQQFLEEAAPAATGGEYTDGTGFLNVTWTNSWTEIERNEEGVRLTNPANSIVLYIASYPTNGLSWQGMADVDVAFLYDDQGADATLVGPTVSDTGFSFVTDGDFGWRVAQGSATESPDTYVLTFAADFPADLDAAGATQLVQEAQAAVMVNGTPALSGLETMI